MTDTEKEQWAQIVNGAAQYSQSMWALAPGLIVVADQLMREQTAEIERLKTLIANFDIGNLKSRELLQDELEKIRQERQ